MSWKTQRTTRDKEHETVQQFEYIPGEVSTTLKKIRSLQTLYPNMGVGTISKTPAASKSKTGRALLQLTIGSPTSTARKESSLMTPAETVVRNRSKTKGRGLSEAELYAELLAREREVKDLRRENSDMQATIAHLQRQLQDHGIREGSQPPKVKGDRNSAARRVFIPVTSNEQTTTISTIVPQSPKIREKPRLTLAERHKTVEDIYGRGLITPNSATMHPSHVKATSTNTLSGLISPKQPRPTIDLLPSEPPATLEVLKGRFEKVLMSYKQKVDKLTAERNFLLKKISSGHME
eukprot:TRINITY_DN10480_c0_g1_i1.p1 TRINITY_DN10480_c0_g1~~TRINITY_DN10480_c0_g1_i1.p1  ORF type:complete len:293 (-),score=59.89 TRINITY_DN10480_c0_g1_i1:347-1225(-)